MPPHIHVARQQKFHTQAALSRLTNSHALVDSGHNTVRVWLDPRGRADAEGDRLELALRPGDGSSQLVGSYVADMATLRGRRKTAENLCA